MRFVKDDQYVVQMLNHFDECFEVIAMEYAIVHGGWESFFGLRGPLARRVSGEDENAIDVDAVCSVVCVELANDSEHRAGFA